MVVLVSPCTRTVLFLLILVWGASPDADAQPVTQPFTFSLIEHNMPHLEHAVMALGDYDNDGTLDVFLTGIDDAVIVAGVYRNQGKAVVDGREIFLFEETGAELAALAYGAAAWGDYDGDGDLDLVVTGSRSVAPPYLVETVLYRNTSGDLSAVDVSLEGFHSGAAAWGDFDNDGDLDLLLGGERSDRTSETRLYRNDGGALTEIQTELPGMAYGDAAWGDADGDGDLDLVIGGTYEGGMFADIYDNDAGTFTRIDSELAPSAFAEFNWGDFDRDGDLDLLQTGGYFSPNILEGFTRIYANSNGAFDSLEVALPGAVSGAGTWGDYDNDGDLDLFIMGATDDVFGRRLARIYANEESGFTDKIHFVGVVLGSATWGDLDGDGDLDLIATGLPSVGDPFINIYENRRQVADPPLEPGNLSARVSSDSAVLQWNPPPSAGASYNLRVGTKPSLGDVVAPMSNAETGRRLVPASGNAQQNTTWTVRGLDPGTYYWSVQAVDFAFTASRFAPEQQFTIARATSAETWSDVLPNETVLHSAAPNPSAGPVALHYDLAELSVVTIRIHDLLGRTIAVLHDQEQGRGRHSVVWNGRNSRGTSMAAGLYICELRAGSLRQSVTLVVAR